MSCLHCHPAEAPYDHLIRVSKDCLEHGPQSVTFDMDAAAVRVEQASKSPMAIHALVQAGWMREGAGWTHPSKTCHLTQAKAYATLLWEEGSIV